MKPVSKLSKIYRFLFWGGLCIRLGLMTRGGSHYFEDLFLHFIDDAVREPFMNPWLRYPSQYFPYGSVLYLLLFIPKFIGFHIFGEAAMGQTALSFFLMKLPLLGIDFLFFKLLKSFVDGRGRQLITFFWLNPILIYITYVHGQLDMVSMYFLFLSIDYLFREKYEISGLAFAAALLSKFHVAILLPLFFAFIWKKYFSREATQKLFLWLGPFLFASFVGFLPHIFANQISYVATTSPEALRIFGPHIPFGDIETLLLGVFAISLALGRLCLSTSMSPKGFLFACGLLVSTLLLATLPMPGWYYWVIPFFALLTALNHHVPKTLWVATLVLYFIYFGVFFESDRFSNLYSDVFFTLLQSTLVGWMMLLWFLAVRTGCPLQNQTKALVLGVAGDSGAGKNKFAELLKDFFTETNLSVIEGDDYHKWERGNNKWTDYTHLHPRANHLDSMAEHMSALAGGQSIFHAHYDHGSGAFTLPRELKPSKTILVQGLLTFYTYGLRKNFDLKIFLDPDPLVRLNWKLSRDTGERGHTPEAVVDFIKKRKTDSDTHINPQKRLADWVISYFPVEKVDEAAIIAGANPKLGVRYSVWNDLTLSPLFSELAQIATLQIKIEHDPNDMDRLNVEFIGAVSRDEIAQIAVRVLPGLRSITRAHRAPVWGQGYEGIHQLTLGALLSDNYGGLHG